MSSGQGMDSLREENVRALDRREGRSMSRMLPPLGSMGEEITPEFGAVARESRVTRTRGVHGSEPWDYSAGVAS